MKEKDRWINELINHGGVCRTPVATPGLLIRHTWFYEASLLLCYALVYCLPSPNITIYSCGWYSSVQQKYLSNILIGNW